MQVTRFGQRVILSEYQSKDRAQYSLAVRALAQHLRDQPALDELSAAAARLRHAAPATRRPSARLHSAAARDTRSRAGHAAATLPIPH